jgi:Flp pilus assembly pilin Flp
MRTKNDKTLEWIAALIAVVLVGTVIAIQYSYKGGLKGALEDLGNTGKNFFKSIGEKWGLIETEEGDTVLAPINNESIDEMAQNGIISDQTAQQIKNETAQQTIPEIRINQTQSNRTGIRDIFGRIFQNTTQGVEFDTQRYAEWIAGKTGKAVVIASDTYAFVTEVLIPLPLEFMKAMTDQGYISKFFDAVENLFSDALQLIVTGVSFIVEIAANAFYTFVELTGQLAATIPQLQASAQTLESLDTSKLRIPESVRLQARDLSTQITSTVSGLSSRLKTGIGQISGGGA